MQRRLHIKSSFFAGAIESQAHQDHEKDNPWDQIRLRRQMRDLGTKLGPAFGTPIEPGAHGERNVYCMRHPENSVCQGAGSRLEYVPDDNPRLTALRANRRDRRLSILGY